MKNVRKDVNNMKSITIKLKYVDIKIVMMKILFGMISYANVNNVLIEHQYGIPVRRNVSNVQNKSLSGT